MPDPRVRSSTATRVLALILFAGIAIAIVAQGFLPPDDALRHAAKAISGRPWSDILILRPGTIDSSPGWHWLLRATHRLTGAGQSTLVRVEVVSLFVLFSLPALITMRRVEAWIAAMLLVAMYEPLLLARLVVGRPLVLSMTVVVAICLVWQRLEDEQRPTRTLAVLTALIAAATWIHGSWYLFALPIIAMCIARRWRAAVRLGAATAVGVVIGAVLTGMPITFLRQSVQHAFLALGDTQTIELVREFRPYHGNTMLVVAVGVIIIARRYWRGVPARELARDPVFILAVVGAVLGFRVARFWMDWALPAVAVFVAREIEGLMAASRWLLAGGGKTEPAGTSQQLPANSHQLAATSILSAALFAFFAADFAHRWSHPPTDPAYAAMMAPQRRAALPDPGGVLYADDMRAFYNLFFRAPTAPWKYMLGYEPGLMPPEDLAVYRSALLKRDVNEFLPWAKKMTSADRLVIHYEGGVPPLGLEWMYIGYNVWSGRTRRPAQ